MADVADEIRKAVSKTAYQAASDAPPTSLRHMAGQPDEDFAKLRAHVRGTLIYAHRQLVGDEWHPIDDRILDAVTNWLEAKRTK